MCRYSRHSFSILVCLLLPHTAWIFFFSRFFFCFRRSDNMLHTLCVFHSFCNVYNNWIDVENTEKRQKQHALCATVRPRKNYRKQKKGKRTESIIMQMSIVSCRLWRWLIHSREKLRAFKAFSPLCTNDKVITTTE